MKKKMLSVMALCGLASVALLCGGCVSDGGVIYGDAGYAHPLYAERGPYYGGGYGPAYGGDYGPAYGGTAVVIDTGSRRGYSDDRRLYRTSRYDGRRNGDRNFNGNGDNVQRSRGNASGRSRQENRPGRNGQAQVQRGRQGQPAAATAQPRAKRGSGNGGAARQQRDQ